ncbi:type II toxin-antitoxin system HigA family antitoxin [uncultured Nostoc sp.]|uniref:helix-turn-helix domain-containing protein n=1 Tax=uncultured Nostoc sp. TaxID=340711 RepID=UPI0035CAE4EB
MTLGLNKRPTYIELLQAFPPRPIKTEEEFFATQKIIDSLIDSALLTSDEEDYLNLLGILVYEYEQTQQPVPDIYGVDLLQVLIEENGLLQKYLLPILKTESIISAILKKRRKLTTRHIE